MADSLFSDLGLQAAKLALDGLSQRQQVISRNLANVDTPGYRAVEVQFEDVLKRALQPGSEVGLARTHAAHLASPTGSVLRPGLSARPGGSLRADGNNVDIDVELLDMTETGIKYQALTQAASKKLQLLKTIVMSR